jgi:hypothetical protein
LNISYLNLRPPPFSFMSPSPNPGMVLAGIIFPLTYMCTQYLYYTHSPTPFPHLLRQDLFCTPVLWFCKRKNITSLFKIALRGRDQEDHGLKPAQANSSWDLSTKYPI